MSLVSVWIIGSECHLLRRECKGPNSVGKRKSYWFWTWWSELPILLWFLKIGMWNLGKNLGQKLEIWKLITYVEATIGTWGTNLPKYDDGESICQDERKYRGRQWLWAVKGWNKEPGENGIMQAKDRFSLQKNFRNSGKSGGVKTKEMLNWAVRNGLEVFTSVVWTEAGMQEGVDPCWKLERMMEFGGKYKERNG